MGRKIESTKCAKPHGIKFESNTTSIEISLTRYHIWIQCCQYHTHDPIICIIMECDYEEWFSTIPKNKLNPERSETNQKFSCVVVVK